MGRSPKLGSLYRSPKIVRHPYKIIQGGPKGGPYFRELPIYMPYDSEVSGRSLNPKAELERSSLQEQAACTGNPSSCYP